MNILYEDSHLFVINKPVGLTVNRSSTTGDEETLFDWLDAHRGVIKTDVAEFNDRRGVVHRLDKDTSGALIIAKTPEAFLNLQKQFKERLVKKEYNALVYGQIDNITHEGFTVNAPIGRNPRNRFRQAVVATGREAVTEFAVVSQFNNATLLAAFPKSGRTHQIRVHLCALNHAVCGDPIYSPKDLYKEYVEMLDKHHIPVRMFLHARRITFSHPAAGVTTTIEAALPAELQAVLVLYARTNQLTTA